MIEIQELHKREFFELTDSQEVLFFSGKYGILLFQNGTGYIPYYWNGSAFEAGIMISEVTELDKIL